MGKKDASSKDKDADTPAKQETWAKIANASRLSFLRKGMTEAAASQRASGMYESA